jgi:hypothetical protein
LVQGDARVYHCLLTTRYTALMHCDPVHLGT